MGQFRRQRKLSIVMPRPSPDSVAMEIFLCGNTKLSPAEEQKEKHSESTNASLQSRAGGGGGISELSQCVNVCVCVYVLYMSVYMLLFFVLVCVHAFLAECVQGLYVSMTC